MTIVDSESKLDSGRYYIASDVSSDKLKLGFDVTDSINTYLVCSNKTHAWELHHTDGMTFHILNHEKLFLSLTLRGENSKVLFSEHPTDESEWIIQEYDDSRYKIIHKKYRLCMRLGGLYSDPVRPVVFTKCNNKPYEYWHLAGME
jgi:hypothetical protein